MASYTGQMVKRRALALDETVKWLPLHDAYYLLAEVMTSMRAAPLVVMQEALLQIEAHASSEVYGATCGVLCGGHYRDPRSDATYLLVEGIERAARLDRDADPAASLAADLSRAIAIAERAGRTVVGWYRFDVALSHRVPATDAGIHRSLFPEGWQVALLRDGADGEGSGAFIRVEPTEGRAFPIPFLELIPHKRAKKHNSKRTSVQWRSYTAEAPVVALPVDAFHDRSPRHAKKLGPNDGAPRSAPLAGVFARWSARRSSAAGLERPVIPRSPAERVVESAAPPPSIEREVRPPLNGGVIEPPQVVRPRPPEESWPPPEELSVSPEELSESSEERSESPEERSESPEQLSESSEELLESPGELLEPPSELAEPPAGLSVPFEDLPATFEDLSASFEDLSEPLEDLSAPFDDLPAPDQVLPALAEAGAAVEEDPPTPSDAGASTPEFDDRATIADDPRTVIVERDNAAEAPPSELDALFTEWRPGADVRAASGPFSLPRRSPVSGTVVKRAVAAVALIGVAYAGVQRVRAVQESRGAVAAGAATSDETETREVATGRLADAEPAHSTNGRSSDGDFTPEQKAEVRSSLAHISDSRTALVAHLDTLETVLATSRNGAGEADACARAGSAYQSSLDDLARIDLARKRLASLVGPMRMAGIDSLATIASDLHPRLRNVCPQ